MDDTALAKPAQLGGGCVGAMMLRVLSTLLLLAPLACSAYSVGTAPRSLSASRTPVSTIVAKGSLNLKTQVVRAKMAAKGRHRLCVFKCVPRRARPARARAAHEPAAHAHAARRALAPPTGAPHAGRTSTSTRR